MFPSLRWTPGIGDPSFMGWFTVAAYFAAFVVCALTAVRLPQAQNCRSVYHLYVILVEDREGLQSFLQQNDIATGLHYPVPLHRQKAYQAMKIDGGELKVSEELAKKLLSLPMFPDLTEKQVEYVAGKIREFQKKS